MRLHSETYDSYKNAEGEWSDIIPSEWTEVRVKDLFKLVTDAAPADNNYELLSLYAGIGVKPRKDMEARGNKASSTDGYWIVRKNDIVVNKLLAWMGSVGLSEYDGVTSPAYDVLRQVKPHIDPRYFAYLFRTETAKKIFRKNSRGIMDMRLRLYFDRLGAITVPLPSYPTQKAISEYIDQNTRYIDKKSEILRQKIEAYRKLKYSILLNAVTRGVNEAEALVECCIDWTHKIPKGWTEKRIKDVTECLDFARIPLNASEREFIAGAIPYWGANGIVDYISKHILDEELVLLGEDGAPFFDKGKDVAFLINEPVWVNNHIHILRAKREIFAPFLCHVLNAVDYKAFINGSTRDKLTQANMNQIMIPLPPISEQKEISNYIDTTFQKVNSSIISLDLQIKKLKELRIALINDAVTGKIRVSEISRDKEVAA